MRALVVSLCLVALSCKEKARSWPRHSELVEAWPLGPLSAIEGELRRWCHTWKGTRALDWTHPPKGYLRWTAGSCVTRTIALEIRVQGAIREQDGVEDILELAVGPLLDVSRTAPAPDLDEIESANALRASFLYATLVLHPVLTPHQLAMLDEMKWKTWAPIGRGYAIRGLVVTFFPPFSRSTNRLTIRRLSQTSGTSWRVIEADGEYPGGGPPDMRGVPRSPRSK
jgi:hypothetical protein